MHVHNQLVMKVQHRQNWENAEQRDPSGVSDVSVEVFVLAEFLAYSCTLCD